MSNEHSICGVILAAGKGTRMKSSVPKVLHPLMGSPILSWVLSAVKRAGVKDIVLVLSQDHQLFSAIWKNDPSIRVAVQKTPLGTGDAVASAANAFEGAMVPSFASGGLEIGKAAKHEWVLIVTGDTPAISATTLKSFIESTLRSEKKLSVLGMEIPDPRGYGRLIRNSNGTLSKIIEERDADGETKKVNICNTGLVMAKTTYLFELLSKITPNNAQNEFYLTDIFYKAAEQGQAAHVFTTKESHEFLGINDRIQLESLESWLMDRKRQKAMASGATLHIPSSIYIEECVETGQDVEIFPNVTLMGRTKLAQGVKIEAGVVLNNVDVGAGSIVGSHSVLTNLKIMAGRSIGAGTIENERDL
jgi:bifunctional UDP-N-acetylglucosamine pyrophosphorylase/glucosamine-1-phosphate N-acetyltransferase